MLWEHDRQGLFPGQDRNDSLTHYGVPGMHWGEITKEYQKKGYDHRYDHTQFKNKNANAIAKIKRRREAQAYQAEKNRLKARKMGQNVGDNFFYAARQKKKQDEREAYQKAHPEEKKPDIVDRTVEKVADHFGLKEYSKMASDFMKDQAKNMALDHLKNKFLNKGPKEVTGSKAIGKILSKPVGNVGNIVSKAANKAAKAISPLNAVKSGVKFTGKAIFKTAKFLAVDNPRNIHKGIKWLENGGYQKIRSGYASVRNAAHKTAELMRNGASFLSKITSKGSKFGSIGITKARLAVQAGTKATQAGAVMLQKILRRIHT